MQFNIPQSSNSPIKVIGVGGGGSNAVNTMFEQGITGVDFIVCNTDAQALDISPVPRKVQLGATLTGGQGAGSLPEVGKNAAIESLDEVTGLLGSDTSMVFVTAGMGGGTGTGAAPVIAQACKERGILTVGIVTVPFMFEGRRRNQQASEGLEAMRAAVDTLLIIRNDKLRELFGNQTIRSAFANADQILCTAAKGIAEVITLTGEINVDMNDVNTVMRDSGRAIMGSGSASGQGRAQKAVSDALESPLLNDSDITGANFVLLNITFGTEEILMNEIMEITDHTRRLLAKPPKSSGDTAPTPTWARTSASPSLPRALTPPRSMPQHKPLAPRRFGSTTKSPRPLHRKTPPPLKRKRSLSSSRRTRQPQTWIATSGT